MRSPRPVEDTSRARFSHLGPGVDFPTAFDRGLALSRRYLSGRDQLLSRGDFGPRARGRFLSEVPEGDVVNAAA